jgi:hypothetical protein
VIHIYPHEGGWIYQVWARGRCVVIGFASTREQADYYARMA